MIKKPTAEELEVSAAEDRIAEEHRADLRLKEVQAKERMAKLKFSVNLKQKAWLSLVAAPVQITALWLIFWLTLFKRPVPTILESFLRR